MHTLTKKEIKDAVAVQAGINRKYVENAVEVFIEIIKSTLEKGEDVAISGFGRWSVLNKNARRGRNPQTGEKIMIEPRRVVTFSLSSVLKAKLLEK